MPTFEATLPDGRVVEFDADREPTESELNNFISGLPSAAPASSSPWTMARADMDREMEREQQRKDYGRGMEAGTSFTQSIAEHPLGVIGSMGMAPLSISGKILKAAAQDAGATIGASLAGHPEMAGEQGGNLYELFGKNRELPEKLPSDVLLSDISTEHPAIATAGKIAGATVENLPALALIPQGAVGKLIAAGFTADMIANAGDAATRLGTELGKPKNERDSDAITTALSDIIQSSTLAPLAGAHAGGKFIGERIAPKAEAIRELAKSLNETDVRGIDPDLAARIRLGLPPRGKPEMLPEVARTQALVDQALREANQRIIIPGQQSALEALKAQGNEIVAGNASPEFRPGGGRAVGGKVSFMRPAEEMITTTESEIPNASDQSKTAEIHGDVRAQPVEGAGEMPVQESSAGVQPQAERGMLNPRVEAQAQGNEIVPDESLRVTVQKPTPMGKETVPGYVQVDSMVGGENQWSSDPVKLKAQGYDIPSTEELQRLPQGQYTLAEAKQRLSQQPSSPSAQTEGAAAETSLVGESQPPSVSGTSPTRGILSGGALEKWADDQLRGGGAHLGPDVLAAYLVKGAALIERGIINFADWSAAMIKEHGEKIKPHLKSIYDAAKNLRAGTPETGSLKSSRDIVNERLSKLTEGDSEKMRLSAQRATTSEMIPEPVQEQIKTDPASRYQQQSMDRVEEVVGAMPDLELASVPKESNLHTAAALERARRLFNVGKNDEGYAVFKDLEKEGTRLGQLINQFKLLKGSTPEAIVSVINTTLEKAGRDPLNPKQTATALELSRQAKGADVTLKTATDAWKTNPSDANAKVAEAALEKSNQAALNLQRFTGSFQPKTLPGLLKSILQGNLLTPISETANVFGNMSFIPFRIADRAVASALDILDNKLTGRNRSISVGPVSGTRAALGGIVEGSKKIPGILYRGQGDTIKGESRQGLHPLRAWINQFAKEPLQPTKGGKLTGMDRVNMLIEGTFGVPAELMLRGLGAGDAPFKEAARSRVIAEQLRLKNVPKDKLGFAQKFPELFFDSETLAQMHRDTMAAVFQRDSKTLDLFTRWIRGKGDVFDLAVATVAPYKLTPWNIIGEILSYNPVVAFGRTAYEASKGNSRTAKLNAGKFVVGSMLTAAGWWLYKKGLLSPSLDQPDEQQKGRMLSNEVMPPNHVNISGLKRALKGESAAFQPGDETVDVFRAGGLAGAVFYMTANIGRNFEKMPQQPDAELWKAIATQSTLEQARFGLNQSFLSGVEGLLSAVKDGNGDNYTRQWMNTVTSLPLPNSLAALSRATREFKPEFKEAGFTKQAENVIRNRLGIAGLDDYLPLKRDLWGRPLRETPEGRNAIIYQFFDITKAKQVSSDPVDLELYRLWRKTDNSRVIPSLPDKNITVLKSTYQLDTPQQVRFAELVGKDRRKIVDALVINPKYQALSDEYKIKLLERAYDSGRDRAKMQLWQEFKGQMAVKPKKEGFQ